MIGLLLIALACCLVIMVAINIYRRSEKNEQPKEKKHSPTETREEMLLLLKNIKNYEIEAYEGETKEKLKELEKEKYSVMDEWMKESYKDRLQPLVEQVNELVKKQEEFQKILREKIKEWEEVEKEMDENIASMETFFSERTFYPHEFVHELNRLQRKKENVREERRSNPLGSCEEYKTFTTEFHKKVHSFLLFHQEIIEAIEELAYEKKDEKNVQEIKHDLYVSLSQMKLKRTKKLLNELKAYQKK